MDQTSLRRSEGLLNDSENEFAVLDQESVVEHSIQDQEIGRC